MISASFAIFIQMQKLAELASPDMQRRRAPYSTKSLRVGPRNCTLSVLQRHYLAIKLLMAATLRFGSAEHAYQSNLQMAVPYLSYYGMFNAMRANLANSPRRVWGDRMLTIGHDGARAGYAEELRILMSTEEVNSQVNLAIEAKRGRELFSYRFPASGAPGEGGFVVRLENAESFGRLAAELALFNSLCLEAAVERRFSGTSTWAGFMADSRKLESSWAHLLHSGGGEADSIHIDAMDMYRVKHMCRQVTKPVPFLWLIGEGGVEDFFGSFCADSEEAISFNPDEHSRRLLDLP
jgi:hypothetical protein